MTETARKHGHWSPAMMAHVPEDCEKSRGAIWPGILSLCVCVRCCTSCCTMYSILAMTVAKLQSRSVEWGQVHGGSTLQEIGKDRPGLLGSCLFKIPGLSSRLF